MPPTAGCALDEWLLGGVSPLLGYIRSPSGGLVCTHKSFAQAKSRSLTDQNPHQAQGARQTRPQQPRLSGCLIRLLHTHPGRQGSGWLVCQKACGRSAQLNPGLGGVSGSHEVGVQVAMWAAEPEVLLNLQPFAASSRTHRAQAHGRSGRKWTCKHTINRAAVRNAWTTGACELALCARQQATVLSNQVATRRCALVVRAHCHRLEQRSSIPWALPCESAITTGLALVQWLL